LRVEGFLRDFHPSTLNQELSTVARINKCRRQPQIPAARNSRASASSVSRLPRERIRDMTSERFALEKTSGMVAILRQGG